MGDNLTPKPITPLPPKTAPDVRPKTDFEKLSVTDRDAINKLTSNTNILTANESTAEPGIEKAIIVAGKPSMKYEQRWMISFMVNLKLLPQKRPMLLTQ